MRKGGLSGSSIDSYSDFASFVDSPETRSQTMSIYTTDVSILDVYYFILKEVDDGNKDPNGSGRSDDTAYVIFNLYIQACTPDWTPPLDSDI